MIARPLERLIVRPAARRREVLRVIAAARVRLALGLFRCDDNTVLEAIVQAAQRGVSVRVLITKRAKGSGRDLDQVAALLAGQGVSVRRFRDDIKYHAKFIVADDHALVASLNYTQKCFSKTWDFLLLTDDAAVVEGLSRLFDIDWGGGRVERADIVGDRLIVAPECTPRARFVALLKGARHRIRVIDAKLSDPRIVSVLEDRRVAGIDVDVRDDGRLGTHASHGKLLVIDDHTAVIGSTALSSRAFDQRRELSIVVRHPAVLRHIEALWRTLPPRRPIVWDGRGAGLELRL